jgi:hypothetical protein
MIQQTSNFNHSGTSPHIEKHNSQLLVIMFYKSYSPFMKIEQLFSCKVYVKTTYTIDLLLNFWESAMHMCATSYHGWYNDIKYFAVLTDHSLYSPRRSGRDGMSFGFTNTFAISAYHHLRYEFEPLSSRGVLDSTLWSLTCDISVDFQGTPISYCNNTDSYNTTEILVKVV